MLQHCYFRRLPESNRFQAPTHGGSSTSCMFSIVTSLEFSHPSVTFFTHYLTEFVTPVVAIFLIIVIIVFLIFALLFLILAEKFIFSGFLLYQEAQI